MEIVGVGRFDQHNGYWECHPVQLGGALLSVEASDLLPEHEERARYICSDWTTIIERCVGYIDAQRDVYAITAKVMSDPSALIQSGNAWTVYFETEVPEESIVGVEFRGESPFQLIVGD